MVGCIGSVAALLTGLQVHNVRNHLVPLNLQIRSTYMQESSIHDTVTYINVHMCSKVFELVAGTT